MRTRSPRAPRVDRVKAASNSASVTKMRRADVGLVELAAEARQRLVALRLHRGEDRPHLVEEGRMSVSARLHQRGALFRRELRVSWKIAGVVAI